MEWFINHDCCLNHTGSPQVYLCFYLRANHKFLGGRIEEVRLLPLVLKKAQNVGTLPLLE